LIEASDRVERAADLERADCLKILRLDPQRPLWISPRRRDQRGAHHSTSDAVRGIANVVDGDQLHRSVAGL
jgi:hypothetical protein